MSASSRSDARAFGHHFLVGLQKSPVLTDHDKRLLDELRPAGVVFFRENFRHDLPYDEWLEIHAGQVGAVREIVGRDRLMLAIDHEGGRVLRTPPPIVDFGEAAGWARLAQEVGRAMGEELSSLGMNVNFAPVVDVASNPENPVIGRRALGCDPGSVTEAARSFLLAMQGAGVVGCLKHYPGHGDTAVDSHHALPVVEEDLAHLRKRELAPFLALLSPDVRLVMTAHILFPRWDPDWPATLSLRVVQHTLRDEAGYDGVVVTDDVGMAAVAELFDQPGVPARALAAGCDLIAICAHLTDTSRALEIAASLARSRAEGALAEDTLERSRNRIERLLASLPSPKVIPLDRATLERHAALAASITGPAAR